MIKVLSLSSTHTTTLIQKYKAVCQPLLPTWYCNEARKAQQNWVSEDEHRESAVVQVDTSSKQLTP